MMKHLLILLTLLAGTTASLDAQVYLTTTSNGRVYSHWMPDTMVRRTYHVYRREITQPTYPVQPLMRITPQSCEKITTAFRTDTALAALVRVAVLDNAAPMTPEAIATRICAVMQGSVTAPAYRMLARIARGHYRLAALMGSYAEDATARPQAIYVYDVRAVMANGVEVSIREGQDSVITSGQPRLIPAPGNLRMFPKDASTYIAWTQPETGTPYLVMMERSLSVQQWQGAYTREVVGTRASTVLPDKQLLSNHVVVDDENQGAGLRADTSYYYRLRFIGAGDAVGPYSPIVQVRVLDSTAPAVPREVTAEEEVDGRGVRVRWNVVYRDVKGRPDAVREYRVYQIASSEGNITQAVQIGQSMRLASDTVSRMLDFTVVRPPYDPCRSTDVSYFVRAIDISGNISAPSAVATAILADRVPPERVKQLACESLVRGIIVKWQNADDCPVQRFNVYRAFCDYGRWYPCPDETMSGRVVSYTDAMLKMPGQQRPVSKQGDTSSPSCGGPFVLVGSMDYVEGQRAYRFPDTTIPEGSPVCYAYLVSAQDSAGNQSVQFPIPNPYTDSVVCAALADNTAPPPAIITDVVIGQNKATVHATTSVVQDLAGYYLYRTADTNTPYQFRHAMMYHSSSGAFVRYSERLTPDPYSTISCDVIPLDAIRKQLRVVFEDDSIQEGRQYWYSVSTVDRHGNESSYEQEANISTFTYGPALASAAVIEDVQATSDGGSIEVRIRADNPPKAILGYALYRAATANGAYQQIGNTQPDARIIDDSARRGRTYWYRAMIVFTDNTYSDLSPAVEGMLP